MVIAQRLLRVNCPECKKPYKPNRQDLEELGLTHTAKDIVFVKGTGCPECNQTGFCGRIGIFEIIMPDEELRELLEKNPPTSTIRDTARKKGMKTLREEGIIKVMQGLSPVEEVIRVTT